jgi:hypothetical protein
MVKFATIKIVSPNGQAFGKRITDVCPPGHRPARLNIADII